MLTAIKEVVTSRVAAMLTELFTGQKVSFAGGGLGGGSAPVLSGGSGSSSGGTFSKVGGMFGLGAGPVFAGGGSGSGGGALFGGNGAAMVSDAPGTGTWGGGGSAASRGGMLETLKANMSGAKGMLTSLGNIGQHVYPKDFVGPMQANHGAGGAAGGAMLLGGGIMAMDGLRRGGRFG